MANIFNRKDEQVKLNAEQLTVEDFLKVYEGQTSETVLKSVWKSYNKEAHAKKQIESNTTEAVALPEPEVDETTEDEPAVTEQPAPKKAAVKEKPTAAKRIPKATKSKDEEVAVPTRATRIRELIAKGKDKVQVKEILIKEEYEVGASFHSEWNRLNK